MSSKELEMKAREHDVSDADQKVVAEAAEAAAKEVVGGYKKIETGVVEGYRKMESGIVEGFNKVTDKCIQVLFAREGESVKDARKRLQSNVK